MSMSLKLFIMLMAICWGFILLICIAGAFAAMEQVKLAWDPNTEPIDFYTVYVGETAGGPYEGALDVETTEAAVDVDIPPGDCRYFVVTASRGDAESGFSNEVFKCESPEAPAEPTPPTATTTPPKKSGGGGGGCFIQSTIGG